MGVMTTMPLGLANGLVNKSGTITTGGTAQTAAVANKGRLYILIQNPSTEVESLWVRFGAAATVGSPSIEIKAGTGLVFDTVLTRDYISVNAATTGHAYTIYEG